MHSGRWAPLLVLTACVACSRPAARRPLTQVPLPTPDGRPALLVPGPLSPRLASYVIVARYDADKKLVTATQTLRWKHAGTAPVDSLPLHLYMNAFKNEDTVFMKEAHGRHRSAERAPDSWGWIDVSSIRLGDAELRPQARHGADETTLLVPLPRPVAPGEELTLELTFVTQLPEVFARTGYEDDFALIAQWFPKVGVLIVDGGAQRWVCDTFHVNSEFFADFGTYDVTLDVPRTHVVVATGVLASARDLDGGRRELVYRAEDVHDFAWMASPGMEVLSGKVGEVEVRIVHPPETASFAPGHLEAAKRTIETFGRLFYPYPWPIMTVIDPPGAAEAGAGGMEYPTLVTTGGDVAVPGVRGGVFTTVHEVGHNWFQGILASNEIDHAWLDEGVNTYADGIVMDAWLGADRSVVDVGPLRLGIDGVARISNTARLVTPVDTLSYRFAPDEYSSATYVRTAQILKTLENLVGQERFFQAMGAYARKWAFKHPGPDDFFAALQASLGADWSAYLQPAFRGTGGIDYAIGSLRSQAVRPSRGVFGEGAARKTVRDADAPEDAAQKVHEVTIVREGPVPARVEIDVVFTDGTFQRTVWDGLADPAPWKTLSFQHAGDVARVEIDPQRLLLLEFDRLDNARRYVGRSGPAVRTASRAAFWQQTFLSVVGL